MHVFSGSCTCAKVGTSLAISPDCSAIEADRLVEAASKPVLAQVGTEGQARNLVRGRRARKSKSGRARITRRGRCKTVVVGSDEGRSRGAGRRNRGRKKLRSVPSGRWSKPPLCSTYSRAEKSPGGGHCSLAPLNK